jgi:hypothetical protein
MPRTEYRTRELGEAAHASARPWRRFCRTLRARDAFDEEGFGASVWFGGLAVKLAA